MMQSSPFGFGGELNDSHINPMGHRIHTRVVLSGEYVAHVTGPTFSGRARLAHEFRQSRI
jgi:hypothetical protein